MDSLRELSSVELTSCSLPFMICSISGSLWSSQYEIDIIYPLLVFCIGSTCSNMDKCSSSLDIMSTNFWLSGCPLSFVAKSLSECSSMCLVSASKQCKSMLSISVLESPCSVWIALMREAKCRMVLSKKWKVLPMEYNGRIIISLYPIL